MPEDVDATRQAAFTATCQCIIAQQTADVRFAVRVRAARDGQLCRRPTLGAGQPLGTLAGKMVHLSYGRCTAMIGIRIGQTNRARYQPARSLPLRQCAAGSIRTTGICTFPACAAGKPPPYMMAASSDCDWLAGHYHSLSTTRPRLGQIEITFGTALNRELTEDPESYSLEQWNISGAISTARRIGRFVIRRKTDATPCRSDSQVKKRQSDGRPRRAGYANMQFGIEIRHGRRQRQTLEAPWLEQSASYGENTQTRIPLWLVMLATAMAGGMG